MHFFSLSINYKMCQAVYVTWDNNHSVQTVAMSLKENVRFKYNANIYKYLNVIGVHLAFGERRLNEKINIG